MKFCVRSEFHLTEHCWWEYGNKEAAAIISALGKSCSKTLHVELQHLAHPYSLGQQMKGCKRTNPPACPANNSYQHTQENAVFDFLKAWICSSYKNKWNKENKAGSLHLLLCSPLIIIAPPSSHVIRNSHMLSRVFKSSGKKIINTNN